MAVQKKIESNTDVIIDIIDYIPNKKVKTYSICDYIYYIFRCCPHYKNL